MYPHEINSRLSALSLLDFSAQPVPGAQYQDLDPLERDRLRKIILAYHGGKVLLKLPDDELDKALRLVAISGEQYIPTYAGLLLLGKREKLRELMPTAESAFLMRRGTQVTVNETFFLPLLAAIEKIFDFIDARNPVQEMESGMFRISVPTYDQRAVREAVVNAFSHRDYTQLGRVLVQLDEDGLTVSNSGGFIEGVTVQNILSAEPYGRNPVLADTLKRIGLAERSGRGVDRIYEGSLRYGRDAPDYSETTSNAVRLFIPSGTPDERLISLITEEQQRTGEPMPLNALFVLNVLKRGRRMSLAEIVQSINIPEAKIRGTLERLTEAGIIEAVGSGRGRVYILDAKAYRDPVQYMRQRGINQLRYRELVISLAEKKQSIMRRDVIELLRITPPQAYRILNKLVQEGILEWEGITSAAVYRLIMEK